MRTIFLSSILFFLSAGSLLSQSSHYWTQHYGNKSLLLGGAVIGSVTDLGAVYYNPGFLALQENPSSFVLTAKFLQFTNVKMEDGLGEDIDLNKNSMGNTSGLIAGTFKLNFTPKSHFAWVFLTRRKQDIDLIYRNQSSFDVLPESPGEEDFASEIILNLEGTEIWTGAAWSYPLNEHLSVGLSNYMSVSYTNSLLSIDLNTLTTDNHVVALSRIRQYDYLNFGMIFKGGFAVKYPNFSAGISITAPKINLWGSGYMYSQGILAGSGPAYTETDEDYFESNYQENIPAKLKAPLSIGAGAGYSFYKFTIHFSCEWFSRVDKYIVMEPEVFIGQSTGEPVINNVVDELQAVINAGLGAKYSLTKNHDLYMGFSTDFSAASPDSKTFTDLESEIYHSATQGNIYHFSGGTVFELNRFHLTLGLAYNYGIDYVSPPVELPDSQVRSNTTDESASLKVSTWRLLIGFAIKP